MLTSRRIVASVLVLLACAVVPATAAVKAPRAPMVAVATEEHASYIGTVSESCNATYCYVSWHSTTCVETGAGTSVVIGSACSLTGYAQFKRQLVVQRVGTLFVVSYVCHVGNASTTFTTSAGRPFNGSGTATMPGSFTYAEIGQVQTSQSINHKSHFSWSTTGSDSLTEESLTSGHAVVNACNTDSGEATMAGTATVLVNG
jgi:hypothetical protein